MTQLIYSGKASPGASNPEGGVRSLENFHFDRSPGPRPKNSVCFVSAEHSI